MAEFEIRRIQARLIRLEDELENARRDRSGLRYCDGSSRDERIVAIGDEITRATERLRVLLGD